MKIFLEIKKKEKKQKKHKKCITHFWCCFDAVSFFPKIIFLKIY